ncbi:hypothetical protein HK101_009430 [Irineochytrium annulatum]|nr:hypothetical protein HK101_009430 [Irineochytrium annulatum]
MPPQITIRPLPDMDSFVNGCYGLEPCSVRGIVQVIHDARYPLKVSSLVVKLVARSICNYAPTVDAHEVIHRERLLVNADAPLLTAQETLPPESRIDIPFQINLPEPDHQSEIVRMAIRVANLLPPSHVCIGRSNVGTAYEARSVYTLVAELTEPATLLSFQRVRSAQVDIHPFVVYDPRLLPALIQPDSKRWRSAPGDSPIEYEVEISATTLGPGDTFRLAYRLAVAREEAARGVRIKKVSLLIKEHRGVGTMGSRLVRSSVEVVRWDMDEGPPQSARAGGGEMELADLKPRRKTAEGFSGYVPAARPPSASASSATSSIFPQIPAFGGDEVPTPISATPTLATPTASASSSTAALVTPIRHSSAPSRATAITMEGSTSTAPVLAPTADFTDPLSHPLETSPTVPFSSVLPSFPLRTESTSSAPEAPSTPFMTPSLSSSSSSSAFPVLEPSPEPASSSALPQAPDTSLPLAPDTPPIARHRPAARPRITTAQSSPVAGSSVLAPPPPPSSVSRASARRLHTFADSWSAGPGGDGLYVERSAEFAVPTRGSFTPTTPRASDPSLVLPPLRPGPQAAVEVRHTFQVRVELSTINKTIVMECGCVLASVGRGECERVLEETPDLMPSLDYDKIFGNDVWVPPYESEDPMERERVVEWARERDREEEERRRRVENERLREEEDRRRVSLVDSGSLEEELESPGGLSSAGVSTRGAGERVDLIVPIKEPIPNAAASPILRGMLEEAMFSSLDGEVGASEPPPYG